MTFFEKQTNPTSPMHWNGNMQADYLYPSGVAGDKFFKHIIKKDSFLAVNCPTCKKIIFPPRMYCENCFCEIPDSNWIEIPAIGKIELFTIVAIDTYGKKLTEPQVIGLISINGTDGALLSIIKTDDSYDNLKESQVEAVFKPKNEREGNIKDILYFKKK